MKSFLDYAITIYGSIIEDAIARWPELESQLRMDLSYLRRDVEARGLSFLTITFPELDKVLCRALDQGYLTAGSYPKGIRLSDHRPKSFGVLWDKVFDSSSMLRSDVDIDAVFFLRQVYCLCKKFRLTCHPKRVEKTLHEFYQIEERLPRPYPDTWDCEDPTWSPRSGHPIWGVEAKELEQLALFPYGDETPSLPWDSFAALCKRAVRGELGQVPDWSLRPKHGPGVVSEGRKVVNKYDYLYWPRKLNGRFPYDWYATGLFKEEDTGMYSEEEPPSRLICVPKTQKGPRLIAAEPAAHQWMQQSIWRWLEDRVGASELFGSSITFRSQDNSRFRALRSSIDAVLSTIDLSSASDRLSCRLVEYVFQGSETILDALHACRTRALSQTIHPDYPKVILLKKFAPMGSACTFPVQSIVFFLITLWACKVHWGTENVLDAATLRSEAKRITVFGDDIIAPTDCLGVIKLALSECGLKVNSDKTYGGLHFRESCGMDAFKGVDVTPAYTFGPYDDSPTSIATVVEESNNFHTRGLWRTAEAIVNQLPTQERNALLVKAVDGVGGLGLVSYVGEKVDHLKLGWDRNLQRGYRKALGVTSSVPLVQGSGIASLSQYFAEEPDPMLPWKSGQAGSAKVKKTLVRVYE